MWTSTTATIEQPVPYALRACADITALRIDVEDGHFVVICGCEWRTDPSEHVRQAIATWYEHRHRRF